MCVSTGNSFNLQCVDKQQHYALRSVNTSPLGIGEPIHFIKLYYSHKTVAFHSEMHLLDLTTTMSFCCLE